jgi:rod shape-determining protein MreC
MLKRLVPARWWNTWGPLATTTTLSILLLSVGDSVQIPLVRGLRSTILFPFSILDTTVRDLWKVREENSVLRAELAQARLELGYLKEVARENERVTRLIGIRGTAVDSLYAGRVVGRSRGVTRDWNYLTVHADLPPEDASRRLVILTPEGLVGSVVEHAFGFLTVRSLASPKSAVHVVDLRSRVAGVVRADVQGGTLLRLEHVPVQEDVVPGDTLITSGQGFTFPRGIPVGRVARVEPSEDDLIKEIWVEPFVKFSRLEEVFVTAGLEEEL